MAKYLDIDGLTYLCSQIKSKLATKVDKIDGKGLSANDYTTTEKSKLSGIEAGANKYTHPTSGVTAGTYTQIKVDADGHVLTGSNPTTLSGYGISDAAAKVHTHTISQVTDFPAAIKNPTSLTLIVNGVTTTYDGSTEKSVTINEGAMGIGIISEEEIDTIITK